MMSSVEKSKSKKITDLLLFNPFHYLAGIKAFTVGIIVILLTGYLTFLSDLRFMGLMSLDYKKQQSAILNSMLDGLIAILIISLLLLVTGKIISKSRFRIIDVIGTQALARFPYFIIALIAAIPGIKIAAIRYTHRLNSTKSLTDLMSPDLIPFVFLLGIFIFMTVWMITLMYRAFSVSCNVTGRKAIFGFGICYLIGAPFSQVVISNVPVMPESHAQVMVEKIDIESKMHELLSLCAENRFDEASVVLDDEMKSLYSIKKIKAGWDDTISRFGPYKNHGQILVSPKGNYYDCDAICFFEKGWVHYRWTFDRNGNIVGFEVR